MERSYLFFVIIRIIKRSIIYIIFIAIIMPHRMRSVHKMRAYCYRRSSVVDVPVCLSVGHAREPCNNG